MYDGYDEERIGIAPEWAYNRIEWLEKEITRLLRDANENYILIQDLREKIRGLNNKFLYQLGISEGRLAKIAELETQLADKKVVGKTVEQIARILYDDIVKPLCQEKG